MTRQSAAEDDFAQRELPEPRQWLEEYGDVLYRYALSRLRRPHDAEEMVQETLLAALQARINKDRSGWLVVGWAEPGFLADLSDDAARDLENATAERWRRNPNPRPTYRPIRLGIIGQRYRHLLHIFNFNFGEFRIS